MLALGIFGGIYVHILKGFFTVRFWGMLLGSFLVISWGSYWGIFLGNLGVYILGCNLGNLLRHVFVSIFCVIVMW
jgi:hypothetical protein